MISNNQEHYVFLISCSDHKGISDYKTNKTNNKSFSCNSLRWLKWLENKELRRKIKARRRNIFRCLIEEGKIFNSYNGTSRKCSVYNLFLRKGYDLGHNEVDSQASYTEAYKRYEGRFFLHLFYNEKLNILDCQEILEKLNRKNFHIFILSALYGLIDFADPIQAYSCHLEDIYRNGEKFEILLNFWKAGKEKETQEGLCDKILIEYLKRLESKYNHVFIVDLLSSYSYQHVFNWKIIKEKFQTRQTKLTIWHRETEDVLYDEHLPALGKVLRKLIVSEERTSSLLNNNKPWTEGEFKIFFSEEDPVEERKRILKHALGKQIYNKIEQLNLIENLIYAENIFRKYTKLRPNEIMPAGIIEYFRVLEFILKKRYSRKLIDSGKEVTLKKLLDIYYDENRPEFQQDQLDILREIRNYLAHSRIPKKIKIKEVLTPNRFEKYREILIEILKTEVKKLH